MLPEVESRKRTSSHGAVSLPRHDLNQIYAMAERPERLRDGHLEGVFSNPAYLQTSNKEVGSM